MCDFILYFRAPAFAMAFLLFAPTASAEELQSYTEPYLDLDVAAGDIGVIKSIDAKIGDRIQKGQTLACLDDEVLQSSLAVAKAAMDAVATMKIAEIELSIRRRQHGDYVSLHRAGDINQRELDRAEEAFQQATARMLGKNEELQQRKLEYARVKAQLAQRKLVAPIDGYVVAIKKQVGEYVSPTDPVIMQIVDVRQLRVRFAVPIRQMHRLQSGQRVSLLHGDHSQTLPGVIESISPLVEPGADTQQVSVVIDNADEKWHAGVACYFDMDRVKADKPKLRSAKSHSDREFSKR